MTSPQGQSESTRGVQMAFERLKGKVIVISGGTNGVGCVLLFLCA